MGHQFLVRSQNLKHHLTLRTYVYDNVDIQRTRENGLAVFEIVDEDVVLELIVKRRPTDTDHFKDVINSRQVRTKKMRHSKSNDSAVKKDGPLKKRKRPAECINEDDSETTANMNTIVSKSTIELQSDIPRSSHETHKCGILHATNKYGEGRLQNKQHCFVWLSDTSHYGNVYDYLVKYGYNNVVFIPYSCQKSWIENYPLAPLHSYTDSNGKCVDTADNATATSTANHSSNTSSISINTVNNAAATSTDNFSNTPSSSIRINQKQKQKLFPEAILSDFERDALHVQIYRYFAWLHSHLAKMEASNTGIFAMIHAGLSIRAVENVVREMERGIRAVSLEKERAAKLNNRNDTNAIPLLENGWNTRGRVPDFDEMFDRLMAYREIHGHVDVPCGYKNDYHLAEWVKNLRTLKKKMEKRQLEQPQKDQQITTENGDTHINEQTTSTAPKRASRYYRTLTQEKIDRLNNIGFTWTFFKRDPTVPIHSDTSVAPQPTGQPLKGESLLGSLTREQAPGIGWPSDEDILLTECMKNPKSPLNWEEIACEHGRGRTAQECHNRWTRYLKPGASKGHGGGGGVRWREDEDAAVLRAMAQSAKPVSAYYFNWTDIAHQLPGRSGKQIRDRWINHLNPALNHLPFSPEDDLRLWEGHKKLRSRWTEISVEVFNSTRSENHIKNRWYSAAFKKFIANEFGPKAYIHANAGEEV